VADVGERVLILRISNMNKKEKEEKTYQMPKSTTSLGCFVAPLLPPSSPVFVLMAVEIGGDVGEWCLI